MSGLTTEGENALLGAAWPPAFISAHNVDIPADATSEPARGYRRKAITWASARGGSMAVGAPLPVLDIPAGFTVRALGLWSAETGGVLYGHFSVNPEHFPGQGTYTLMSGSVLIRNGGN